VVHKHLTAGSLHGNSYVSHGCPGLCFVCVCVWFMHEYRHACIVLTRMQFIDCSGADELKAGWDVKEIDLQGDLT